MLPISECSDTLINPDCVREASSAIAYSAVGAKGTGLASSWPYNALLFTGQHLENARKPPPGKAEAHPGNNLSKYTDRAGLSLLERLPPHDGLFLPPPREIAAPGNACTGIDFLLHAYILNNGF